MRSLVIPYFAWNTIWTLFAVMLALIPLNIFSKSAVFVWDGKTVSILKGITLYQYNGQYWYLFQLIILTIFCKLIQRIVETENCMLPSYCYCWRFVRLILKWDFLA